MGVSASISKPTPFMYLAFEKMDSFIYWIIWNVDPFILCPLIFLYPFITDSQTNIAGNSLNTKRTSSLKNLWVKSMCIYQDVRKSGAFHIPIKKNWLSHILFIETLNKKRECISFHSWCLTHRTCYGGVFDDNSRVFSYFSIKKFMLWVPFRSALLI